MEIDVLINDTPELDLKFVMNDVGVAQIVSLPLGKDYTIAEIKLALAAEFLGTVDDLDEVRALAKRLVLRRLGNKLYDGNTAYSASLVDGATVVVERLSAAPMRPRRSEQKAELVHHTVPVGAMVFDTYGADNELWGLVETGAAMIAVQLAFEADPVAAARAAVPRHALLAATQDSTAAARAPALLARQLGSIETEEPPSPAPSIEAQAPLQPPPPPRS